jgi:hypothetical protein
MLKLLCFKNIYQESFSGVLKRDLNIGVGVYRRICTSVSTSFINRFKAGNKSLRATPLDEIFYWEFCFLNRAFREKPSNTPIIYSVY